MASRASSSANFESYARLFLPGARVRLSRTQWWMSGAILFALPVTALMLQLTLHQVLQLFVAGSTMFFATMLVFAIVVVVNSLRSGSLMEIAPAQCLAFLAEQRYPFVTIMVAIYKEATVVAQLVQELQTLVYPRKQHEILIIVEEDDLETILALQKHDLPTHMRVVVRPRGIGTPNKPGALMYVLQNDLISPNSEITVIFDAEDKPSPDQLLQAVTAMHLARLQDDKVVCVQARLAFTQNATKNWLTRMISLDYLNHFGLMLPGLARLNMVAPLGGTSNYILTATLRAIEYDPYNVTEDLDLAVRLARLELRTRVFDSVTHEEAVTTVPAFVKQKSRWIKGGIQTYFSHMRNPFLLWQQMGMNGFLSFQAVVGAPLVLYLINPLYWLLTLIYAVTKSPFIESLYPPLVFYIASVCFVVGNFLFVYFIMTAAFRTKQYGMVFFAIFAPLYWGLLSLAACKAFYEFFSSERGAHKWEKTAHKGAG